MENTEKNKLKVLDLFSGIGGFSLGLEWTNNFKTIAFCENDLSCHKVLKKHWPNVPIYFDIKELNFEILKKDKIPNIDIIVGGFPCQDISTAGKGAGIKAARSGLWSEMCRLINEVRPKYAIMENVSALLFRGLECVLGDLAEIGYDAEWHCIPVSAIGAPHRRDRIWIIAYPSSLRHDRIMGKKQLQRFGLFSSTYMEKSKIPDTDSKRFKGKTKQEKHISGFKRNSETRKHIWECWSSEPELGRVADGIPNRVDRLRQLGNAVVPQIPYLIGLSILELEKLKNE